MFIQHKQLKALNLPANRVARLNSSGGNVQLLFPGYSPQSCGAYLLSIANGNKVLVIAAFFLSESQESIFFVPKQGEVNVEEAEAIFEEGFEFVESMGFVLSETDYHILTVEDQQKLWSAMPICQQQKLSTEQSSSKEESLPSEALEKYRQRSLESLGRFLSSL